MLGLCLMLWAGPALAQGPATQGPATQAPAPATPSPVASLDDFYADPVFSNASLSPDGHYVAIVQTSDLAAVLVTDLKTRETAPVMSLCKDGKPINGLSVDWVSWKGDDRLIIGATLLDIQRAGDKPDGAILSYRYGRLVLAVDRDGKNFVQLLKGGFFNSDRGQYVSLLDVLHKDPDHILAIAPSAMGDAAVWKVDVHTGEAQKVEQGDSTVIAWDTDSNGDIVARYRDSGSNLVIEGRSPGQSDWTTVVKVRPKDAKVLDDFQILGATEQPGQLYVAVKPTDKSQGDTRRLRIYDFKTKTLGEPVWPALKYDIQDIVYDGDSYKLSGVCYVADIYTCDFKDPVQTANFRGIVKYFKGLRNIYPISVTDDARWWLFSVSGPQEPGNYYLFDWQTKQIEVLAGRFPKLPDEALADMQPWTYAARDGAAIPAYLTRPPNAPKGPLPLIVMPHGGPEARDDLGFDTWGQYLSTRGYLVFQPNFRGSGGYGVAYGEAGYGQWGGLMADDITDGVRQLIASGQADPNRICIFGASYGGYAALYAGATHPELYKCVVSWAGLSDLTADMKYERTFGLDSSRYLYWLKSIGDPKTQAEALRKASPITYADVYKPPVLLIHGMADENVRKTQSTEMADALTKAGKSVKLILVKNEDHTDWDTANEKMAISAVADFIKAHIAPATAIAKP